jgi:short-subunit dehydrogenase
MSELKPVTLVTGASSGIGAALAREFATHGHELVLVARRADKLNALADRIAAEGRSRPRVIAADLARDGAAAQVAAELRARGLEPQNVVNSAGFGMLGAADTLGRAEQLAMIDVNARALTDLSLRFVDSIARHRGGILNVGSVLGFVPGPGMAVYHATKAYVLSFTEALGSELAPLGIRVTALCPGPVETEFGVRAEGFFSYKMRRSAERVASEGYAGFMKGQRVVVPGFDANVLRYLPRLLSRGLVLSMMGRSKRRRHDALPG